MLFGRVFWFSFLVVIACAGKDANVVSGEEFRGQMGWLEPDRADFSDCVYDTLLEADPALLEPGASPYSSPNGLDESLVDAFRVCIERTAPVEPDLDLGGLTPTEWVDELVAESVAVVALPGVQAGESETDFCNTGMAAYFADPTPSATGTGWRSGLSQIMRP